MSEEEARSPGRANRGETAQAPYQRARQGRHASLPGQGEKGERDGEREQEGGALQHKKTDVSMQMDMLGMAQNCKIAQDRPRMAPRWP